DYGQIYHTSDAGAHWENQSISNLYILQNTYWLNSNVGFAGGVMGLFRTTNGGANWTKLGLTLNGFFGMTFANDTCGWIVSSSGVYPVLYETTNAGADWTLKSTITQINIVNDIDYIEGLGIWIIGTSTGGNKVLLSTNYGNSFVDKTPASDFAAFWRVQFVSATDGWATGDTYIYRTTDAGTSWAKLYPDNDLFLRDFYAIDSVHAWAAGDNGKLVYSMGENSSETNGENNTENNTNGETPSGLNGIPSFPTILIIFNITWAVLIIERKIANIRKSSHNKA
ncbi:MAG: WD40/YVTN/BNR-like repeat-containing protein, partial [Promethearchaeota archaeon]